MPHFGIFCPPVTGHLNPMMALGRTLRARGHRVTFLNVPDIGAAITAAGFEFLSLIPTQASSSSISDAYTRLSRLSSLRGVRHTVEVFSASGTLICAQAPALIRAAGIDRLLVDQYEMGGACVAEYLNIPFVTVCCGLPYNWEPLIPPVMTGWPYEASWFGHVRSLFGRQVSRRLGAPILRAVNGYRRRWSLIPWKTPDQPFSRLAQLAQGTAAFDFPRRHLPSTFHYIGRLHSPDREDAAFPWERLNGKPFIYASLGTLQTGQERIFQNIAAACATEDVQLVLSTGGRPVQSLGPLAGDPLVVSFAPQLALLARAELAITHGGFNTVLDSLWQAVPMVAIPITNDQPACAARIRHHKLGAVLRPAEASPERLRAAIRHVRADPEYQVRMRLQQTALRRAGGTSGAADVIETVMRAPAYAR